MELENQVEDNTIKKSLINDLNKDDNNNDYIIDDIDDQEDVEVKDLSFNNLKDVSNNYEDKIYKDVTFKRKSSNGSEEYNVYIDKYDSRNNSVS